MTAIEVAFPPGATPVTLASDHPQLLPYRDVRDKDRAREDGTFIIEGETALRAALAPEARFPVESVLVSETRLLAKAELFSQVRERGIPVLAAPQREMDALVGFPIHRGILAVGRRVTMPPEGIRERLSVNRTAAPVLVLMGLSNHDNIGSIFRNAAAFGVPAVLLDEQSGDPLYRKSIRVSVGGALWVPFARLPRADIWAMLRAAKRKPLGLTPSASISLRQALLQRQVETEGFALVLGAEGPGLDAESLRETTPVSLPMRTRFDSLNVAVASGIALYEYASTLGGDGVR